ncbi:hypothetical protein [Halolamina salina]|uniref:Uncharacterized protein n=1 Tax=Halolamina salina TaxID=1220023 RepID=A0ABD6B8L4_9EURY
MAERQASDQLENETKRRAESYLGTVVRDQRTRYQEPEIESPTDAPMLKDEPTIVGETPDGHRKSWGLSIFEDLEVVTTELEAPDRPAPVVEMSVQEGLITESIHYQSNAVVECECCGELVREPDATPHMGEPTDAHDHSSWRCDSCSSFSDEEAEGLDVDEDDLESCPFARWSDRLQAWTIGSDYRIDDGLWQPDEVESATVETPSGTGTCDCSSPSWDELEEESTESSAENDGSEPVLVTDGGVDKSEDEGNRLHLYLVTSHPKEEYVGLVESREQPYAVAEKNVERRVDKRNVETNEGFVMKVVGLGYHDFESSDPDPDHFSRVTKRKLAEIDDEYLEQAGVDVEVPA